ncbi:MAG TPA: histidine phosphatase family protein [Thermoanaerobaculia bacterium]|nr:histidine phosphatase family protein [Thermoanaerobaculia bacterium]
METTLILVRHGESQANLEGRFTRHDDEPLTPLGLEQARAIGRRLRELYQPVALYASPFARARDTAREIGAFFELEPEVVRELHEQSFGALRGRGYAEYYPLIAAVAALDRWHHRAPGGESLAEVGARVGPALDLIADRHPGEEVIVVSHGGVMAALRSWVAGNFDQPPESTENAGGYRLLRSMKGYRGPIPLF